MIDRWVIDSHIALDESCTHLPSYQQHMAVLLPHPSGQVGGPVGQGPAE